MQEPSTEERIKALCESDAQFRDSFPIESITKAKMQPGMRLSQIVETVMEGYADRPALGQRARELVTGSDGRKTLQLLPRFDTISFRDLWARAKAMASAFHNDAERPAKPGDFACILGFTSPDYANLILSNIHLGLVNVPLQTSAPRQSLVDIMEETHPYLLASGIDYLDAAVDALLAGYQAGKLVVLDYRPEDDDQRAKYEAAEKRLADAGSATKLEGLEDIIARGKTTPPAPLYVAEEGEDPLAWLFYTSGSTGTPKGAIFTESLVKGTWLYDGNMPAITLSFMPMAHLVGNGYLLRSIAAGGSSYCSPRADLSMLYEDLSLVRPTMASLVPRVCELLYHHYLAELDRRIAAGANPDTIGDELKLEMRNEILGGRLLSVGCGSASLAPETYAFMEEMLGMHMPIGYSSTEIAGGTVLVDWKVQRPPVIDYRLDDVPDLGYFSTDKPHPRGELLVKSDRFMGGYYKQEGLTSDKFTDDGYFRTGDVMEEIGPDHLVYLDRCNNVTKLSQGEFVAISKLEALYSHHANIQQIYVYGHSERAYLLAVIVPSDDLIAELGDDRAGQDAVKSKLRKALQEIATQQQLNGYEIPRDFLIETEPFSLANGLLTEIGKHRRPNLRERYAQTLEDLYARMAQDQLDELRALRSAGSDRPVIENVSLALQATLGVSASDVGPDARFEELGGDSLAALTFSNLLEDIFGVEVPVGVIISPAGSVQHLSDFIEAERNADGKRASYHKVHDADDDKARASELTLDKFLDADLLAAAPSLPKAADKVATVLLTGTTGFLGRFMLMSWLERMGESGGKVICVTRGTDDADARARIVAALDTDPKLMAHFNALADKHLEVLAGDLGLAQLGLSDANWNRLAQEVDLIAHPAAHVNHVLPYNQLFGANVVGTAELIRLALTNRQKAFHYVSTLGVMGLGKGLVGEDDDIRQTIAECDLDDSYANGYGVSKWAGEVLLREANDLCGLPVAVFRPGMILAHSDYRGQINVPDMFSRLIFSLVATGLAPATFYAQDLSNGRPKARYDGFSANFLADAITAIGLSSNEGFRTFNLSGQNESDVSLDTMVDWLIEDGAKIERIDRYDDWVSRFETAMRGLPEAERQQSMLAIFDPYRAPQHAASKSHVPSDRFNAAAVASGQPAPALEKGLIVKYVDDLRCHGFL